MSLRRPSKNQPEVFEFNSSSLEEANKIVSKYPKGKQQSAVMALLYIAQKQNDNWIPLVAMKYIAKFLDMPYIKVYEVATFYTMYNLSPVGKYFVQVCTTTPCMIRGANQLVEACKEKISENEN
ncbi:NAD(P)H-dependent oxidoreductase subunit E, partial [Pelagibacterales bacterium SAG-MED10]|nr:NAD(P)H-dependent oxidoreductase subunit E [Pelagibacterales bacterium SAG-MED10]